MPWETILRVFQIQRLVSAFDPRLHSPSLWEREWGRIVNHRSVWEKPMHMCSLAWAQLFLHADEPFKMGYVFLHQLPRGQPKVDSPSLRASSQVTLGYVNKAKCAFPVQKAAWWESTWGHDIFFLFFFFNTSDWALLESKFLTPTAWGRKGC